MEIQFRKLYRHDRIGEHCHVAVPFAKGTLTDPGNVRILQNGRPVPVQTKVTSRYEDGSVRFLFARFLADLPGNKGTTLELTAEGSENAEASGRAENAEVAGRAENAEAAGRAENAEVAGRAENAEVASRTENAEAAGRAEKTEVANRTENAEAAGRAEKTEAAGKTEKVPPDIRCGGSAAFNWTKEQNGLAVVSSDTGYEVRGGKNGLNFSLANGGDSVFQWLDDGRRRYEAGQFSGPLLKTDGDDGEVCLYRPRLGQWTASETGPLTAVFRCMAEMVPVSAPQPGNIPERGSQNQPETACPNTPESGSQSHPEAARPGLPQDGPQGQSETACPNTPENGSQSHPETACPGLQQSGPQSQPTPHEESLTMELKLTAWAGKPWIELSCRPINSTSAAVHIVSLIFSVMTEDGAVYDTSLPAPAQRDTGDSVGEGADPRHGWDGPVCRTNGVRELASIEDQIDKSRVRTCAASSNYRTNFAIGRDGAPVSKIVDAKWLVGEANEHYAEVFYGTFFADRTDEKGGVCATVFQAQQNYPKAVKADRSGVYVMLVPEGADRVVMESGTSREQRMLLHFHGPEESLEELDNRSLIYQMPDRPSIPAEVYRDAGVMPDIFVDKDKIRADAEMALIARADSHARCYGMMNWGDAPDPGYTSQGRGKGSLVWTNNEYDYPHSCALLYARTGERRFLDYMLTACSHWMDVDVCHYSRDPMYLGGQWEHCRRHCLDSTMVCSHQWVEGLLDCYHFTGDERALETALGIGRNVLGLLRTPAYQKSGESTARETGWALRSLTALYQETHDSEWLRPCDRITAQFREWFDTYGGWISPYTDNTMVRVPFMISVAIGSLMRYYRVAPSEDVRRDIRSMILAATDDLIENCLTDTGLFYYKELPSLNRQGNNTLILETLAIACELTGDKRYLEYGLTTFRGAIDKVPGGGGGGKTIVDDAVIQKGDGTKGFAQSFIPMAVYYKALTDWGM